MKDLLERLGLGSVNSGAWIGPRPLDTSSGAVLASEDPSTALDIAAVSFATKGQLDLVVAAAEAAQRRWRLLPAPKRGEIVREMGHALRAHKDDLGRLITREVGKLLSEGRGEVQEAIDMADFAVGLSRQLYGLSMHSERPGHRMYEQWHPLGTIGVITAFNFPHAVWAWNAMLALVCGDAVVWKPSFKAPLTAIATHRLLADVLERHGFGDVLGLVVGADAEVGEAMIRDARLPLISATGSVRMGRHVGEVVASRLGRCLLELGGNNGIIVEPDADLELALRAILFAAVGTAGQRCTSARRLFVHEDVAETLTRRLVSAYQAVRVGDPEDSRTLMGPLIDARALELYQEAVAAARAQGGTVLTGGELQGGPGYFVKPTLIAARPDMAICREETFAPILYVFTYQDLETAIAWHNDVPQGLSSAIFTGSFRSSERFLSVAGSDCGIANVNIGTSGAEIGGAFGGEKETGGGREAGSDSWKAYMRRQTCTLNYSADLPLAQGVRFDL